MFFDSTHSHSLKPFSKRAKVEAIVSSLGSDLTTLNLSVPRLFSGAVCGGFVFLRWNTGDELVSGGFLVLCFGSFIQWYIIE